jgi:hypothetical protein
MGLLRDRVLASRLGDNVSDDAVEGVDGAMDASVGDGSSDAGSGLTPHCDTDDDDEAANGEIIKSIPKSSCLLLRLPTMRSG